MIGYVFSPAAEDDLRSIWLYTADNWGIEQADLYTQEIRSSCQALVSGRSMGRPFDEAKPGYRKLAIRSHFVVYRIAGDIIDVIRVLHQRMDVPSRLSE